MEHQNVKKHSVIWGAALTIPLTLIALNCGKHPATVINYPNTGGSSGASGGGTGGGGGGGGAPAPVTINIPNSAPGMGAAAFGTNPLHVPLGTQVFWHNTDSMAHTSTSNSAIWDTGNINAGATSAGVTFNSTGTFGYFCNIHNAGSMSGTIIVP